MTQPAKLEQILKALAVAKSARAHLQHYFETRHEPLLDPEFDGYVDRYTGPDIAPDSTISEGLEGHSAVVQEQFAWILNKEFRDWLGNPYYGCERPTDAFPALPGINDK